MTTNAREPRVHPVPILSLRPTQMTVGMREVKEKRKRWREHDRKKQSELLGKHMIPVVRGSDERYYVIDHHHLARALLDEGVKDVLVTIVGDLTMV
ncbi:MAG: ParB-like protein, partial [Bradyrhizobium guangdongense]